MTMKEAGVTRKQIIDFIIYDIQKDFDLSKAKATEYFNEALSYDTVVAEIRGHIEDMIENPESRLDWSSSETGCN